MFEPRDSLFCDEVPCNVIVTVCVQHDGMTLPLHGHSREFTLTNADGVFPNQINGASREKKFVESPWIGQEGRDQLSVRFASDEKAVGASQECGPEGLAKKAHDSPQRVLEFALNSMMTKLAQGD